jgi:pimeloyl-ACP methyl ester carboxylesterase
MLFGVAWQWSQGMHAKERIVTRHIRLWSFLGLFALFIGIACGNPAIAQQAHADPDSQTAARGSISNRLCPVAGPVGEVEGKTYYCGLLYVPENYDEPDGRQIQITYAVLKSASLSPLPDPIIYLEGGPGGSAIDRLSFWAKTFADQRQSRDVIIFDQRGTKYSTRLDCDPFLLMLNYLIDTDPETQQLFSEISQSADGTALSGLMAQIYMQGCAEGLTEAGYDLTQYNSRNSVKDLFELTDLLGYDQVNLYGISYGTRLALTAMRDHPDQIRSVVLDSTYPPQINNLENMSNLIDEVLAKLVATCENDAKCNAAYPHFGEQLAGLIERSARDPELLNDVTTLLSFINNVPAIAEYFPLMVDELDHGVTTTLMALVNGELPKEEQPEDLPGDQDDLLLEAQQLQQSAEELFKSAAEAALADRPGAHWIQNVYTAMAPLSRDDTNLAAIALLTVFLQSPTPSSDMLSGFVRGFLPEDSQADLIAELDELSPIELQYVYDLIAGISDNVSGGSGLTDGMYYSVECNEEVPFNDLSVGEEIAANLHFPELGARGLETAEQIAAICSIWPSGKGKAIETQPVESDIPTLILAGDYDTQTPISWGEMAREGLTNAQFVEFPASGHGVIVFSDCAKDVASSFISQPDGELATGCTADLAPDFVLPGDTDRQASPATPEAD